MGRIDPKKPFIWWLVQFVEYLVVVLVLGRIIPPSTPTWVQVVLFVLVFVGLFALNYYVVMPRIGRSSRARGDDEAIR
jgi:hypothetical protein